MSRPDGRSVRAALFGAFWRGRQASPLNDGAVVLLEVLDTRSRDRQTRVVGRPEELLLGEVPNRELEVFARTAKQLLEIEYEHPGFGRLRAPPRIEHLEDRQPNELLGVEIVLLLRRARDQPPTVLAPRVVDDVVFRALGRIAEDVVGVGNHAKAAVAAGLFVVGVKALSKQP